MRFRAGLGVSATGHLVVHIIGRRSGRGAVQRSGVDAGIMGLLRYDRFVHFINTPPVGGVMITEGRFRAYWYQMSPGITNRGLLPKDPVKAAQATGLGTSATGRLVVNIIGTETRTWKRYSDRAFAAGIRRPRAGLVRQHRFAPQWGTNAGNGFAHHWRANAHQGFVPGPGTNVPVR
jgi:hypothetical protein